jgi:hypothetical protein
MLERLGICQPLAWQMKPADADRAMNSAAGAAMKLDTAQRQLVIDGAIANVKAHYVDRDVAQKVAEAVRAHEKNGDDDAATDGTAFADLLTRQMREVSHDMHLMMVYSQAEIHRPSAGASAGRTCRAIERRWSRTTARSKRSRSSAQHWLYEAQFVS